MANMAAIFKIYFALILTWIFIEKSVHAIMVTLWDKISQNLSILQTISNKNCKSHRIVRPFKRIFYEELIINYTVLYFWYA